MSSRVLLQGARSEQPSLALPATLCTRNIQNGLRTTLRNAPFPFNISTFHASGPEVSRPSLSSGVSEEGDELKLNLNLSRLSFAELHRVPGWFWRVLDDSVPISEVFAPCLSLFRAHITASEVSAYTEYDPVRRTKELPPHQHV